MRSGSSKATWIGLICLAVLVIVVGFALLSNKVGNQSPTVVTPTPIPSEISQQVPLPTFTLGQRTKTTGCVSVNGLPDRACTPGDIDPKIIQDNINQTICVSGYTKTVRPPVTYTNNLKIKQIQEYGYTDTNPKDYEEDHLISLELGGSPTSEANLWPEPYTITLNAHEKDKVENYLHDQICSGKMKLLDAQLNIATNWEKVYKSLP